MFPDAANKNENLRLMLLDATLLKEIEAGKELLFKGIFIYKLLYILETIFLPMPGILLSYN